MKKKFIKKMTTRSQNFKNTLSTIQYRVLVNNNKIDGYKILTKSMIHNDFTYKMGINKLNENEKFIGEGDCLSGGLYFCEYKDIDKWINYKNDLKYICEVELLPDSKIYKQENKIKTDTFILKNKMLLSDFLVNNINDFNKIDIIFDFACINGHIDIVNLMIEKGANDWNGSLFNACWNGHIDIVNLMIDKGANDWNGGLYHACYRGNIDIVNLMIEKGANDCRSCNNTKHSFN